MSYKITSVSIHAPVQVATGYAKKHVYKTGFQSTHPYRLRLDYDYKINQSLLFQSTHPYRLRLASAKTNDDKDIVSIHAPVQVATIKCS